MSRLLRSTRGQLVALQVGLLTVGSGFIAIAVFELATVPVRNQLDQALYDQWSTIADQVTLQDGRVVYVPGTLPDTSADTQAPVEAEVFTADGLVIQTRGQSLNPGYLDGLVRRVLAGGRSVGPVDVIDSGGGDRRVFAQAQPLGQGPTAVRVVVVVSLSRAALDALTRRLLAALGAGGVLVVVFGGGLGWLVVGRTLRPVRAIAAAARAISEQDLQRRVDVRAPADELGELKDTFNQMLARLERSFATLRRFTADASHELRSPLTLMRTEVEVALGGLRSPEEYRRVLHSLEAEIEHSGRVVDQLLLLAQSDAGDLTPLRVEIDVADFVEEAAARWRGLSGARKVTIDVEAPPSGTVAADPDLLRRVVDNLLDNAVRHSPELGVVTLRAHCQVDDWWFEVADQGPGVPAELRTRIFDRFSRADTVRTRRGGGAGLGLALSGAVAEAHGGNLELLHTAGRPGATFRLRLPAHPRSPEGP